MGVSSYDVANNYVVCTSTTRPSVGVLAGLMIYETDTGLTYTYSGSAWVLWPVAVTKWKTADQSVAVTTYVDDTHLTFPVAIGAYTVDATIYTFSAATTTGPKVAFNGPTASTVRYETQFMLTQGASGAAATISWYAAISYDNANFMGITNASTSGLAPGALRTTGFFIFTAAGTLALRIAAEAVASCTYSNGSHMTLTRVA